MNRHRLLRGLHEVLQPRTYFEIGVNKGISLALSRVPSVGVDPFFNVSYELNCDVHLVRTSSDEFFARKHPFAHFDQPVIDLAFIDGMHLAEYALRDFMNTERFCHPGSVIVFDDMLARNQVEAARDMSVAAGTGAWAGDVFKVIESLRRLRPDLIVIELDTEPTGTLMVLLPDRRNRVLHDAYDALVREYVVPDPQTVPDWCTSRSRAVRAEDILASDVWAEVRRSRDLPSADARALLSTKYEQAGLATAKNGW